MRLELLCESCGYTLEGLSASAACSECGRPVAESLPTRRAGSAWQRRVAFSSWLSGLVGMVRRPNSTFGGIRPDPTRGLWLMNLGMAGALVTLGSLGHELLEMRGLPETPGSWVRSIAFSIAFGLGTAAIFGILTMVEILGLRLFSRRLVRRIPYRVLWAICSHASYGWLVGGLMVAVVWGTAKLWHLPVAELFGPLRRTNLALAIGVPMLASGFLGILAFETLVYLGVRKCRYLSPVESEAGLSGDGAA